MVSELATFTQEQRPLLLQCVTEFQRRYEAEFVQIIRGTVHYFDPPSEIAAVSVPLKELYDYLDSLDPRNPRAYIESLSQNPPEFDGISIPKRQLPVLKRAIMLFRRDKAVQIESKKALTHNPDLLDRLELELRPLEELTAQEWFKETTAVLLPRLTSYISNPHIEILLRNKGVKLKERHYDEKFQILQAPQLFLSDLHYYREVCEIRGVPVIAAYIDIDDFKVKFNSNQGEVATDRNVLPRFMSCLESHTHSHGYGYRYGGDEYAILIPGFSSSLAIRFLDELREKLAALSYRNTEEKTTVSIGLCVVDADCFLTDREIEEHANRAMKYAKDHGRNCIATYASTRFDTDELYIVSPDRN